MMDVCIVGGGAAGLCAAVLCARGGVRVTLLEALPRVGKKLLATGNGRCNLTNLHVSPECYRGDRALLSAVLGRFSPDDARAFFASLGLVTYADPEGRVYPRTEQAASVLDVLRLACGELGVRTLTGSPVERVTRDGKGFLVICEAQTLRADRVLIAAGGRAQSGFTGYELAKRLGHTVTPLTPALCAVPVDPQSVRALKGIRLRADVTLLSGDQAVRRTSGEVQFTDRALSGICVFDLARDAVRLPDTTLRLDLLPDAADTLQMLCDRAAKMPARAVEDFLAGLLPKRAATVLLRTAYPGALTDPVSALSPAALRTLAGLLRDWRFHPKGSAAWELAQVTSGGVPACELTNTLQSRVCPGLYFAGEIVDVDGDCGGFNLHWAWASAFTVSKNIHAPI